MPTVVYLGMVRMKPSKLKNKSSKGSVGVEVFQGRLRLHLPRHLFEGRQKYLTLGLANTTDNFKLAAAKAKQIESDIAFERFDFTLTKYKPQHLKVVQNSEIPEQSVCLIKLWKQYVEYRKPQVSPSTVANQYAAVTSHLKKLPIPSLENAIGIRDWLISHLTLDAAKRTLVQLNACCKWAKRSKLIPENPFIDLVKEIKVRKHRQNDVHPFTRLEQLAIIEAFEDSQYIELVKFLFLTGCRTGEALGLKWKHITHDLGSITFAESLSGQQKFLTDTKTHKPRKFPCNSQLKELLKSIKPAQINSDSTIFTIGSVRTFQDNWKRRVNDLVNLGKVEGFRPQYNTRHTFITNCLESGVSVVQVAKWVGNSPEIIMKHYAGTIQQVQVPNF